MKIIFELLTITLLSTLIYAEENITAPSVDSTNTTGNVSYIIQLTDRTFENYTELLSKSNPNPWFIMFYAEWCPHCNKLKPVFEELAANFLGQVKIGMIDCETNRITKNRFSVEGFPTLILFYQNKTYKFNSPRNLGNLTGFLMGGFQQVDAQEIPPEGFEKPISPYLIGGLVVFMVVMFSFIGWLIWAVVREEPSNKPKTETEIEMTGIIGQEKEEVGIEDATKKNQ